MNVVLQRASPTRNDCGGDAHVVDVSNLANLSEIGMRGCAQSFDVSRTTLFSALTAWKFTM